MSRKTQQQRRQRRQEEAATDDGTGINSLLDVMEDGAEYQSVLNKKLKPGRELLDDVIRAMREIAAYRGRACISYIGNVASQRGSSDAGVDASDDLPFHEMVTKVPDTERKVDVLLATNGGSAHQIGRFVNCLRARFDEVDFLLPSFCMSAGTLFALSGDRIWMSDRACLGPIDPQVPTHDGRYVPAQALLLLVNELEREGMAALADNREIPWTAVRIIDSLDKKELGDAITATSYSTTMATEFLKNYKLKNWTIKDTSKEPVTDEYRATRAEQIAMALVSHDRWKSHGHSIPRDVLWNEIQLKIDHPDDTLERLIRRFWAVWTWIFDKTPILKAIVSPNFRYLRHTVIVGIPQ